MHFLYQVSFESRSSTIAYKKLVQGPLRLDLIRLFMFGVEGLWHIEYVLVDSHGYPIANYYSHNIRMAGLSIEMSI